MMRIFVVVLLLSLAATSPALAEQGSSAVWLQGLDDLMTMTIESVSRKDQRIAETSAAVHVITRDEIRRSGMRTVADVLRLAPGVHVAQIDGNKWAVTVRGLNGRWSNKLLVMIDGHSVYTPYLAGTYWDAVDVPVQAIERIEIVRGPGASIWGANAVNGVVNIITMGAAIQRETIVAAGMGSTLFGSGVHDGRIGARIGYRVFADASGYGELDFADDTGAYDDWTQRRAGALVDVTLNTRDRLEASVRANDSRASGMAPVVQSLVPFSMVPTDRAHETDVWSMSARWTRQLVGGGRLQVEGFVDDWSRGDDLDHNRRTFDLGFQHHTGRHGRHDLIWGAAYRHTNEQTIGSLTIGLTPERYQHRLTSAFAQNEITVADGRGHVVLGTKLEHREQLGWNTQPTARFLWELTPSQSVWTAVSRAMRAPDRVERGMSLPVAGFAIPDSLPAVVFIRGSADVQPEWLTAYEAGYRTTVGSSVAVDLAAYSNHYSDIMTVVPGMPAVEFDQTGAFYLALPQVFRNALDATTAGGEAVVTVTPGSFWKVTGAYTLFSFTPRFTDPAAPAAFEGAATPGHQGQLRASVNLPFDIEADATVIAASAIRQPAVPAWTRADARLAWRPIRPLELSLVGQNLFGRHVEFASASSAVVQHSYVPRTAYGAVTWKF